MVTIRKSWGGRVYTIPHLLDEQLLAVRVLSERKDEGEEEAWKRYRIEESSE